MKAVTQKDIIDMLEKMDLNIDIDALDPGMELTPQGVDSLDMMNLFFNLEEIYSIKITEESLESDSWNTIDDIVRNVNLLIAS